MEINENIEPKKDLKNKRKRIVLVITITILFIILWAVIRPGVFTIQPIGALPEGITIIYYSRGTQIPLFSSPDGLCLQIQGSVSLLCRMMAINSFSEIADRIIFRLPYSHWAYLQSTGGLEFEN